MIGFGSSMAMYDNTKSLLLGRGFRGELGAEGRLARLVEDEVDRRAEPLFVQAVE